MPIFEYQCRKCNHEFEFLVLPTLSPPECPTCKSQDLEKLISSFALNTDSIRKANAQSSRRDQQNKYKEVAHEEHKRIHSHDH